MSSEKIVIFTKNWLGDVIFEEPFIRALKRRFSSSSITCITHARCRPILEANPNVDHVLTFDDRKTDRSIGRKISFIHRLAHKKFTHGFLLHRSFSRALIFFLAGIPKRYGYAAKRRAWLLTDVLKEPLTKMHRVDYLLNMLKLNDLYEEGPDETNYRFYYTGADEKKALQLINENNLTAHSFICINPGANWVRKRWPSEYFAYLADSLEQVYKMPIVITGSSEDQLLASEIMEKTHEAKVVSLCGATSLCELGALFAKTRCVISADSGPLHIASGVGTRSIALFGPTDVRETGPRGIGKAYVIRKTPRECMTPCFDTNCAEARCMRLLKPEDVRTQIQKESII